jgi:hypothetical protein
MLTIKTLLKTIFAGILLTAIPVFAHHSTSAFDNSKVIRIEGTITQFRWINPHASIKLEGKTTDGVTATWTVEMTAPNSLLLQGWKRNSVQQGDKVVMFVNPLKNAVTLNDGSQGSLYVGVVLGDGSTLGQADGKGSGSAN